MKNLQVLMLAIVLTVITSYFYMPPSFATDLEPNGGHIVLSITKNSYFPGEFVPIFGTYASNSTIQLSLSDPHGVVVQSVQTVTNETGRFLSSDIQIPTNAIPGIWMIRATSGVFHASMEINVISSIIVGPTSPVDISNIRIQPSTVKVGDKFAITATLVNNSHDSISIGISPCGEPFPISFDNHTIIYQEENTTCADYILEERIDPDKNTTQTSPGAPITTGKPMANAPQTVFFKAVQAGIENATISFGYNIMNQADSNQSQIQKTASKSFLFVIYDNKTDFSNGLYTDQLVTNTIDSPLQQLRSGIKSEDVQCDIDFQLILKRSDNSPACIKKSDVSDFMSRTWATGEITAENTDQSFNHMITGLQIEQTDGDLATEKNCGQFYTIPNDDHHNFTEIYPVLILKQNSTGCAKLTFTINYKYNDTENGAAWPQMPSFADPFNIGKYIYTSNGNSFGVSSKDFSSLFKIDAVPNVIDLAKYPVGSQFTVTEMIRPLSNATGFYDYSIEEIPCVTYPLVVGFGADQINSSDFSKGMITMHNHSCIGASYEISSVQVSGMDFKQVKFQ